MERAGRVLPLRNEREEWELPGGRLELGETPSQCVARELAEETGWVVEVGPILDAWMYLNPNPWIKATASNRGSNCVELRRNGNVIELRDSKDPNGPVLSFTGGVR